MGVDVDTILGYGIFFEDDKKVISSDDYCDGDDYEYVIKQDDLDALNMHIIHEGYNGDWVYLGVNIFDKDKDKFCENIQNAESKFNKLVEKYNIALPDDDKPEFHCDYYYC